jgi:hypothetical protein
MLSFSERTAPDTDWVALKNYKTIAAMSARDGVWCDGAMVRWCDGLTRSSCRRYFLAKGLDFRRR